LPLFSHPIFILPLIVEKSFRDYFRAERKREETEDHDNQRHPKNRVQPRARSAGEDNNEEQGRSSLSGRIPGIIKHSEAREEAAAMKKTGAKKEERFAKKAGKTWLDPMCTPFETR